MADIQSGLDDETVRRAFLAAMLAIGAYPLVARADATAPVYPGAVAAIRPAGVGLGKPPPSSAKTYSTSDSFEKVRAWYRANLSGAQEVAQPEMEQSEDAFLIGNAQSGMVVMIQAYQGQTWIVIGPPM